MGAINWLQYVRHAIGRKLPADGRSQMRNQIEVMVVAERICLNVPDRFFYEARRQRIFAEDQFI